VTATVPSRPALRWFGGKWRLAPWIVEHLPPHDAYVEPYGGAASVLLRKPPAKLETWNDLHGRLVNFFTVLREQPEKLIELLELTPYAREEYERAREVSPDPIEDARRFFVLGGQGRVGAAGSAELGRVHGWRYVVDVAARHGSPPYREFSSLEHLREVARRFRHVQIENDQATTVVERYDAAGVLHYVDPPYWDPTADFHSRYAHSMKGEDEHVRLAEVLHACRGMVVLSGRPSALYERLYGDWRRIDRRALNGAGLMAAEVLWLNPAAAAAAPQRSLW
jgi:DNA adenine methylase